MSHTQPVIRQSAEPALRPTATELASIAVQLLQTDDKKTNHGDGTYAIAAETAYKLSSACRMFLRSTEEVKPNLDAQVEEVRRVCSIQPHGGDFASGLPQLAGPGPRSA
jgi:hypothetical protein